MAYNTQSKYHIIVDDLKASIYSGRLNAGEAVKSEKQLSEEYTVSRSTVRKALSALVDENLIFTIQGKGYFVSEPQLNTYTVYLNDEMSPLKTRLIGVKIVRAGEALRNKVKYNIGNKALEIMRYYYYDDDELVGFGVKYIPFNNNVPILERDFQYTSFEDGISNDSKALLFRPLAADNKISEMLHTYVGAPILKMEQTIVDKANNICSYEDMFMLGDRFVINGE